MPSAASDLVAEIHEVTPHDYSALRDKDVLIGVREPAGLATSHIDGGITDWTEAGLSVGAR